MADPLDILSGRVTRSSNDDWTATLGNIAAVVASIPERRARAAALRARMDVEQENAQLRQDELRLRQQNAQQQQAAQQRAAQMDQAVSTIMQGAMVDGPQGGKVLDRRRFIDGAGKAGIPPERLASILGTFDKIDESVGKAEKERLGHVADLIDGVLEHGGGDDALTLGLAVGKANNWLRDQEVAPIMEAQASGKDIKPMLAQIRDSIRGPKEKPKPIAVAPGGTLVNPETGAEVFKAPAKPENPPNVGSFEDYVTAKFGARPTPAQITQARKEYNQADDRPRVNVSMSPEKLVRVEHKDPKTGKTVIEYLPQGSLRGQTFEKGTSATIENRLASSEAVNQTGNDIIAQLRDPKVAAQVGPAMGRYNSLREFIGNPPPELAELAGSIESYSLANMGVHGMRSVQGAAEVKKLLDAKHTPESLIKTIQGLNKFSQHFMENQGREAPSSNRPKRTANPYAK